MFVASIYQLEITIPQKQLSLLHTLTSTSKLTEDQVRTKAYDERDDIYIQCSLVKPPPSVQSVVWRYNEFGDKLRDIENRKLCDHMKR